MFGADFNPDEIREKLSALKEKVEITKEDDGVVLVFTDPDMMNDPSTASFFSPASFESFKNMIPGGEDLSYQVQPLEDRPGAKFLTSDPDALYDLFQKIFDPDFLLNIVQQLMNAFAGPGGLLDGLKEMGSEMEKLGDEFEKIGDDEQEEPKDVDQDNPDENEG